MLPAAELVITTPDGATMRHSLREKAMIGRHPECEVVLTDPMSSRRHCKIERAESGLIYVEDNGSANGTLHNNEPLKARTLLNNGDTLQIGGTHLVLRLDVPAKKAAYEQAVSIVHLDDEEASEPSFDFAQNAEANVLSDDEASSSDIGKLKRVTERLAKLIDISKVMGTTLDSQKLLNICLDKLFEIFPQTDRGIVVLAGPDGSLPSTRSPEKEQAGTLESRKGAIPAVKYREGAGQDNDVRLSRTVVNRVRSERQAVLVSDASGDAAGLSMARFEIKSLMCAPLLIEKADLGFIQLETKSRQHAFTRDDVGVLTAVAGQVAVVIRNAELQRDAAAAAAQRENLSRFLSPDLVEEVVNGNLSVALGGTEKKGTIFFSDIVSFTKLAGRMSAQNVVTLLNRYFTVMQNIVFRRGGSIDKCQGDNIMAHWGVLGDQGDFTASAVTAAIEMQIALFTFNRDEALRNEIVLPPTPLGHGIGVNTGIVCAGNIGSDRKIEFTVIGDTVNLSARIEALAGRGQVFVGEPTWEEIKERAFCIRMPDCPAKNVEKPLPIYSVRGIVPPDCVLKPKPGEALPLGALLFSLPCMLNGEAQRSGAMATQIVHSEGGLRLTLQTEKAFEPGAGVTLDWALPEKPTLPRLAGTVEKCSPPHVKTASGQTPKDEPQFAPGTLVLKVASVPPELAAWRPGVLLQSDLKSAEEIIRA